MCANKKKIIFVLIEYFKTVGVYRRLRFIHLEINTFLILLNHNNFKI